MYACPDVMKLMHAYLDGELDVKESIRVQTHLRECSICRDAFASEQAFLDLLRSHMSATPAPAFARHRVPVALARDTRGRRRECRRGFARHAAWLAVSVAVAAVLGAVALSKLTAPTMPGMVRWAVAEHQAYVRDPDSLALHSSDPQAVSRWLEDRLHFSPDLPPERVKGVMLVGAQAVAEGGNHAAHLVYRLGDDTVSLLLTPPRTFGFPAETSSRSKTSSFTPPTSTATTPCNGRITGTPTCWCRRGVRPSIEPAPSATARPTVATSFQDSGQSSDRAVGWCSQGHRRGQILTLDIWSPRGV